jgi:hypothetical protein
MAAGALADIRSHGNCQRCPYPLSLRTGGLRPPSTYVHDRTDALLDRTYSADFGDGRCGPRPRSTGRPAVCRRMRGQKREPGTTLTLVGRGLTVAGQGVTGAGGVDWFAKSAEVERLRRLGGWLPGPVAGLEVLGQTGLERAHQAYIAWLVIRCATGVSTRQVHARSITGPRQVHNRLSNRREPGADVRTRLTGDVSIACL